MGYGVKFSMADWGSGMSASCKPWVQLFVNAGNRWPYSAVVSLGHANQLSFFRSSKHFWPCVRLMSEAL